MTKQELAEIVTKAELWAIKAHAGQKDKAGKDYFEAHVSVVAKRIEDDPIAQAAAFLHDTVEDTTVTMEDIRAEFPKEVANAVDVLTRKKDMSYAEYIWHIQQNHTAVKVKLSDLRSNMDLSRLSHPTKKDYARTIKYGKAYAILCGEDDMAINPYALYDYLLASGWKKAERQNKNRDVPVLKAPTNPLTITVPIDMTLPAYNTMIGEALTRLCYYENAPLPDILATLHNWKFKYPTN